MKDISEIGPVELKLNKSMMVFGTGGDMKLADQYFMAVDPFDLNPPKMQRIRNLVQLNEQLDDTETFIRARLQGPAD